MKKAAIIALISFLAQPTSHLPVSGLFIRSGSLFKQLIKNEPNLDLSYAARLSNAILDSSGRHKVSSSKVAAILAQECHYKLKCINLITKDYGIGQVNHKTIKAFSMDKDRLLIDLEYSVDMSVMVLADFKRMYGKREINWWSRYNSSNPTKRQQYGQLVARFL